MIDQYVTPLLVAEKLSVPPRTVYRWTTPGGPLHDYTVRIGGVVRIRQSRLIELLSGGNANVSVPAEQKT
jgi:hypothetical protein